MNKVLLDEGLSRFAAEQLRDSGMDAVHVQDIGLISAPDDAIVIAAREQGRIVFTLDHDFHQILALTAARSPSVVLLRFEHLKAADTVRLVRSILETFAAELAGGAALSVSAVRVRVRRLPLHPVE